MTSYVVLRMTDIGDWEHIGGFVASNPTTAIRRADNGAENGEYAAVPARAWKTLSYQLVPVVKLAPVKSVAVVGGPVTPAAEKSAA